MSLGSWLRVLLVPAIALFAAGAFAAQPKTKGDAPAEADVPESFVGSRTCRKCHTEQSESFERNAKKAQSFAAVTKMKRKLTKKELEGCYRCHTTGYGQTGGFVSLEQTPELANAGCEVCHGPGSRHAKSTRKADIVSKPEPSTCNACHVAGRIRAFHYRPVLRAGAH